MLNLEQVMTALEGQKNIAQQPEYSLILHHLSDSQRTELNIAPMDAMEKSLFPEPAAWEETGFRRMLTESVDSWARAKENGKRGAMLIQTRQARLILWILEDPAGTDVMDDATLMGQLAARRPAALPAVQPVPAEFSREFSGEFSGEVSDV